MMTSISRTLGALPLPALVALIALLIVQLSLQLFALVDLARRTAVPGGRKWIWAVVIVVGSVLGTLLYLALGRSPREALGAANEVGAGSEGARQRAVDHLYGPDERR